MNYDTLMDVLRRLALEGGAKIMEIYNADDFDVKVKSDESPVTEADEAADAIISAGLRAAFPDVALVTEEQAASHTQAVSTFLIVDPLDGTKEYRGLRDDWAVHVALTVEGQCALGAVALPSQDRVVWGVSLPGQERAGLEGDGELARGDTESPKTVRIACSRSHTPDWMESFVGTFEDHTLVRAGSVGNKVSLCLLGEADVYAHQRGLKEWDTCAPEVIGRALGWSVFKLDGSEHTYNLPDPKNHEFVICRPAVKDHVVEALRSAGVTS